MRLDGYLIRPANAVDEAEVQELFEADYTRRNTRLDMLHRCSSM